MERQRGSSNLDTIMTHNLSDTSHIYHTELSEYLWALKANGINYNLKWSIKLYGL